MNRNLSLLIATGSLLLAVGCAVTPPKRLKQTYSSFDLPSEHASPEKVLNGNISFQGTALAQVLKIYQGVSGRTVLRGRVPSVNVTFNSQKPLTRIELLQMLDSVLAQNGIAMILSGEKAVKAVPAAQAAKESPPEITLPWPQLPDSDSCMSRTVHLKHLRPSEVIPLLLPLSNLPNSIVVIDAENVIILRDYSANIRQELRLLDSLESSKVIEPAAIAK